MSNAALLVQTDILKDSANSLVFYGAMPVPDMENQVKFSVEETDFGEIPAVLLGRHGLEMAPQLRCPAEITYVFKNEPKVKEIRCVRIPGGGDGYAEIPLSEIGVEGKHFWLEIQADLPRVASYRYPYTLFHSVKPGAMAHMFANVKVAED